MVTRWLVLVALMARGVGCSEGRPTAHLPPLSQDEIAKEQQRDRKSLEDLDRLSSEYERAAAEASAERPPVPEGAHVWLLLDKEEYFLGENILVHYCLENRGARPFTFRAGADYRGTSRHIRFSVIATGEDGKAALDPDPYAAYRCMGGVGGAIELKPGEKWFASLRLIRYCRLETPGIYTVRVFHDHGWRRSKERKWPEAEARLKVVMPAEQQARAVVEAMYRLPRDGLVWSRRSQPFPDFAALGYPVYLPALLERARKGCAKAAKGIASIPTPEATRAMLDLLDQEDSVFVAEVARHLRSRLPSPPGTRASARRFSYVDCQRQYFVPRCWRAEFAPALRKQARRLLASREPEAMANGAELLQSVGRSEDIHPLIAALDRLAATIETTPDKGPEPPRDRPRESPRDAASTLMNTVDTLARGGFHVPVEPSTAGEALLFVRAIGLRKAFRPKGWETQYAKQLQHESPYVRQIALDNLPEPLPKRFVPLVAACLGDPDRDVLAAACDVATGAGAPGFRDPILGILRKATDDWILERAGAAACALGLRWKRLEILASRLTDKGVADRCLWHLADAVVGGSSGRSGGGVSADGAQALRETWLRFLRDHRDEIAAGKRFEIGDPALIPALFPGFRFNREGKPDWP